MNGFLESEDVPMSTIGDSALDVPINAWEFDVAQSVDVPVLVHVVLFLRCSGASRRWTFASDFWRSRRGREVQAV